jgi:CRISPR-associated protein Csd1
MILQSLCELAGREGLVDDPDFEPKDVRWVIHLRPGGRFASLENTDSSSEGKKSRPRSMSVPRGVIRTSGSVANFLVDKAEYVLGFDPDDRPNKRGKLASHNGLFAEKIESALSISPEEPALLAVLAFLGSAEEKSRCIEALARRAVSNDLFAFSFRPDAESDATRVHDRPAVRAAWQRMRGQQPVESQATCLACGTKCMPASSHPVIKRVPGGSTSGVTLVSFNAPAFLSFGLEGNDNAPICRACAEAYTTALNRLFHPEYPKPGTREFLPRRSFRLSDDTAVIFWASAENAFVDEFGDVAYADDEAKVESLYQSVHAGGGVRLDDPTAFHALIVTGGQGRATLRGYHRTTVGVAADALRQYFDDVDIVPRFPKAPKHLALRWLIRSLAPRGKDENVDPNLAGDLFLEILNGRPFPTSVLHAALRRVRHEPERPEKGEYKHTRERMALIRASLNRRLRAGDPILTLLLDREISAMLDESCTSPGYCLGRLFAVLEKLQADAIGKPNASIADRFYGSASATPAAVFATLLRKAQHHLSKDQCRHHGAKIEAILKLLDPATAFPPTLGLEEQGLFALGYYHQRADLWKKKDPAAGTEEPVPAAVEA